MKRKTVETGAKSVVLYISPNCWVSRGWNAALEQREEFHILPATEYGLVAVVPIEEPPLSTKPLYAWVVYRPTMLEVVFPEFVRVQHEVLRLADMQAWCRETLPWGRAGNRTTIPQG